MKIPWNKGRKMSLEEQKIAFELHKNIYGFPDIFIEPNICVFADGNYWHNLDKQKKRDKIVNNYLDANGYTIIRLWEEEINKDVDFCVNQIKLAIKICGDGCRVV